MIHKCIYMKKTSCTDEQKNLLIVTLDKRIKKVVINSKVDKAMLQGSDHYALYTYENKDVWKVDAYKTVNEEKIRFASDKQSDKILKKEYK